MSPVTMPSRQPVPALLTLANARRRRRPPGAREQGAVNPFADLSAARALLEPLRPSLPLRAGELGDLAALADDALAIAEDLAAGRPPASPDALSRLAGQASATRVLVRNPDGTLGADLRWTAASAVAELASRIIAELGHLDPARLRHCSREECDLLFYDTTRPGTQRWHSGSPCGLRERQARWRKTAGKTVTRP